MGKKQHQKDKLYLTNSEWRDFYGGNKRKLSADNAASGTYIRLPFCCCSITFQPFEDPCCTSDGSIYEKENILKFITKYGIHPITGDKLNSTDLIDLHFHKNSDKQYCCPVTYRVFNEHSNIVAIRTSGNVYSWDAVQTLNFRNESFTDLLSDVPFKGKSDVIRLQDPINVERLDISKFYHVRFALKTNEDDPSKPEYYLNNLNSDAVSALKKIRNVTAGSDLSKSLAIGNTVEGKVPNRIQSCNISTGALAAAFTSTAMERVSHMIPCTRSINSIIWSRLRAKPCKAYVSIETTLGKLNLELFASDTPKTVHNFLLLCKQNYYNNCKFFRSIRHFILQTGDPTNTGTGGHSAWPDQPSFEDEFSSKPLKHDRRGVVSMANSGPDTNGSQFFITYRPCNQLNKKHAIFGQLVGGLDTLSKIEAIKVNKKDKPNEDISILKVHIFEDPTEKIEEDLKNELQAEEESVQKSDKPQIKLKPIANKTVGKYLNTSIKKEEKSNNERISCEYEFKKKVKLSEVNKKTLKFDSWD